MKRRMSVTLSLGLTILTLTASATAHHSFAGEFDASRVLRLRGTVARVDMMNPHSYIFLDVRTPEGSIERWALESPSALGLRRRGWDQVVKAGDVLGVCGYEARRDAPASTVPTTGETARRLSAAVLILASGEKRVWENYRQGKCGLDV